MRREVKADHSTTYTSGQSPDVSLTFRNSWNSSTANLMRNSPSMIVLRRMLTTAVDVTRHHPASDPSHRHQKRPPTGRKLRQNFAVGRSGLVCGSQSIRHTDPRLAGN